MDIRWIILLSISGVLFLALIFSLCRVKGTADEAASRLERIIEHDREQRKVFAAGERKARYVHNDNAR